MIQQNIKMGNSEPFSQPFQNEVYLDQIQQLQQNDLMFQSKLSNTSHQIKLLKKIYSFNSASQDIINYLQTLNFLGQYIECDNLMLPIYCYIHKLRGVCSDEKQLQIYHEIYNINIKDEITARKRHHQKFSEQQIWYLLYAIVNACRQFQPYKIKSGILKTSHIMLNDRGHVKIKNILSQPQIKPNILPNYFSPEELNNMRQRRSIKIHPNISQTFSIAIIILQICTFIDGQSYYDMHRLKMNEIYIQRALQIVQKQKYSKLLINLLKTMLSSHAQRPLPSQIYLTFKPYQHQIINLQSFKFDPNKINQNLQNSKVSIISQY